jgi:DeoR/GlpR family transcriptional regulator of sugar metabolism
MAPKTRNAILEIYRREKRSLSPKEAAVLSRVNPNTARRAVRELAKIGALRKIEGTRVYNAT